MRFLKGVSLTFITQVATIIIGIMNSIMIARHLGPSGKGIFTISSVLTSLAVMFGNLGFPAAQIYFLGKRRELLPRITAISIWFGLIGGCILMVFTYMGIRCFPRILVKGVDPVIVMFIIVILPFCFITQFIRNILWGCQKILPYNLLDIMNQVFILAATGFVLITLEMGIRQLMVTWVIIGIIMTFLYIGYLNRISSIKFSFDFKLFYDMLFYGIKSYISSLLGFLILRLDIFLVNYYLGNDGVGIYSVTLALGNLIYIFPAVVGTLLFPVVASSNDCGEFTQKVIRHTAFITFILGCMMILLAKPVILLLYGNRFAAAVAPFYWLLPGILFLSVSTLLMQDLAGRGLPPVVYIAPGFALILNILANIILIPKYGISGASISSMIAYFFMMLLGLREFNRITKTFLFETLLLRDAEIKEMIFRSVNFIRLRTIRTN